MTPRDKDPDKAMDNIDGLPIRSEDIGYAPDELVACRRCGRSNAPTRSTCLYCGERIGDAVVADKLEFRELDIWEHGFNVIAIDAQEADLDAAAAALTSVITIAVDWLKQVLRSRKSLPIARVESDEHARFLTDLLTSFGIETVIVSDQDLMPASLPTRLRSIEFFDGGIALGLFGSSERVLLDRNELALIVTGVIFESRIERAEERKRRTTRTRNEMQLSSDSPVVDLYSRSDRTGWRITTNGFDFSCLGESKTLIAADNMRMLAGKLLEIAPHAKFVDDFLEDRGSLERCWPSESRKDAFGFQRSGFARRDLSSVSTTNNSIQLTKYSRLQWHLL